MAAAIVAIAFAALAWMALNWLWLRPKKLEKQLRQQGFQGNSYRFWFGDKKEEESMLTEARSKPIPLHHDIAPRILPFLHKHVSSYGNKSFMWRGPSPRMIIMDPEMIKEILNKSYIYQKPQMNPLFKLFIYGIPFLEGDKWAKHRRLLNPAFHTEKLKCMLPAFDLSCCKMIKKWQEMLLEGKNSCELDVWPSLQTLTSDVISRTAFGSSYEEGSRVFELQIEQSKLAVQASRLPYIPGWRFLPTKMNRRMKEIDKQVRSVLKGVIDKKTKAMKSGIGCTDDLLGILLEANYKEVKHGNKDVGMSIEDVIDECKVFYFAGQETTSVLLVWTMILLSKHPNWQNRAREEVNQVIGNDKVNVDHLNRLKVVTMILYEVLRLYPPVSMILRKKKKNDGNELGDLSTLQAEMDIILPILLIHHDPDIWGADVKEFNPERFSKGVLNATNGQIAAYFPFGGGPRICIGQTFALLEAKLGMVRILKNFSFELSASYTHAPSTRITVQPQYGASLILHKL
ncbi:Cytochrome P450, family 72, subfamily A, polypeptide 15 [Heracleum sosnowskyi]|uniref:Cytochrome P450, family 72, subfamily A, polypeptide 15 n=1 Tax=Heracleum sosnowskyi TaxID=360622 RepID=A0AAD8JDZ7_9APIA|nr:Cytochrome P450, family 72, subfamily A, polypeptide 15 [Heracleum sosnowskyi]